MADRHSREDSVAGRSAVLRCPFQPLRLHRATEGRPDARSAAPQHPWYDARHAAICEVAKVARRTQHVSGNLIIGF
jgi:hypothetical protein